MEIEARNSQQCHPSRKSRVLIHADRAGLLAFGDRQGHKKSRLLDCRPGVEKSAVFFKVISQGELDPLEIGLHACQFVPKEKGGRGKKGGLSEYAKAIGKDRSHVTRCRSGAEVAMKLLSQLNSLEPLLGKTEHLAAIFSLPESTWPAMVELLVDRGFAGSRNATRKMTTLTTNAAR